MEVQSPGGLYGNVTEENLEAESSTRNSVLMRLMEDLHLVENRGSGIRAMLEAMRRAVEQSDQAAYTTSDLEMHELVWQQAGNRMH